MNMLDRYNEHKFLEHQDLNENSFIANVNKSANNIDEIKRFNDYIEEGEVAKLVEAILVGIEETGNKWLVQLQEVALALTAAKSAFNFATLVTIPEDIASGAEIELPDLARYTVGTHMLMVSYNGTTCYIGEQYEEIGEIGETSKKIRMLFDLRANDKIMFRVIALNRENVLGELPVRAEGSTEYRTLEKRFGDVINVKDFGAAGDGITNDTDPVQAAAAMAESSGKTLYFPKGDYFVSPKTVLRNIDIIARDASFVFDPAEEVSMGRLMTVGNTHIDALNIRCENSGLPCFILFVEGNSVIDKINIVSTENRAGTGISIIGSNVIIGDVTTTNIDRPIQISSHDDSTGTWLPKVSIVRVNSIVSTSVLRGLALVSVENIWIGSASFIGRSSHAVYGTQGHGHVIISGTKDFFIGTIYSVDSAETAVRIGGSYNECNTSNGFFGNIHVIRPATCVFKINDIDPTKRVQNIHVGAITGIDVGYPNTPARNQSAVRISHADNVNIGSIICMPVDSTTSAFAGVELNDCKRVVVDTLNIHNAMHAVYMFGRNDVEEDWGLLPGDVVGFSLNNLNAVGLKSSVVNIAFGDVSTVIRGMTVKGKIDTIPPDYVLAFYGTENVNTRNYVDITVLDQNVNFDRLYYGPSRTDTILTVRQGKAVYSGSPKNAVHGTHMINAPTFVAGSTLAGGVTLPAYERNGAAGGYGGGIVFSLLGSTGRGAAIAYRQDTDLLRSGSLAFFCGSAAYDNVVRERLAIKYDGALVPGSDNAQTIGSASLRWGQVYAGTGSINTSDEREKANISVIPDAVLDAWEDVRFAEFAFTDAVAAKGPKARLHTGLIAQRVIEAFAKHDLDAAKYGLLCYDEWDSWTTTVTVVDQAAVLDDDGIVITPEVSHTEKVTTPAGNRYGLRYEEALCLEAAYQRRENEKLKNELANLQIRLNVLESKLGG